MYFFSAIYRQQHSCSWSRDARILGNSIYAAGGGGVSIWRCRLTSIGIPMLKIRRSCDCLIFHMGIPISWKDSLYIETGSWSWYHGIFQSLHQKEDSVPIYVLYSIVVILWVLHVIQLPILSRVASLASLVKWLWSAFMPTCIWPSDVIIDSMAEIDKYHRHETVIIACDYHNLGVQHLGKHHEIMVYALCFAPSNHILFCKTFRRLHMAMCGERINDIS